jgi:hypothetical protein
MDIFMKINDLLDYRRFANRNVLTSAVAEVIGDDAVQLLMFETSKQRNWLFITAKMIYCVTDDRRKDKPHLRWSLPIHSGTNLSIVVSEDRSEASATLLLDGDKSLLYSKRFFTDMPPQDRIMGIIKRLQAGNS